MTPTRSRVESLPHLDLLKGQFVFLSASFPSERRSPRFFESAEPNEIAQAVVAAVRAVLSANGRLVFGGHPTISPLVLMVAEEYLPGDLVSRENLRAMGRSSVIVYQSRFFGTVIGEATMNLYNWGLADLVWTERDESEASAQEEARARGQGERSLRLLRERMLAETKPLGAIFIGGMEGVRDEAAMFGRMMRKRPMYFVGGPGGAARELGGEVAVDLRRASRLSAAELASSTSYPALLQRIVIDMGNHLEG